ncbi:GOLPH3/VPS74 family protein [Streptomyces reniochalinae]|uniref:GPP34 family phosphoprotein n=1 Tax=Streptomyces reniochalinae TaxID=2250578 RepID=A0A367EEG7_9ACTN|nr:GPP34 family phosphoprotein [Streptomyces reniochalinae]RCG16464.1 GPP34 family phosphoprotein [Streptomyces reniochalinae]
MSGFLPQPLPQPLSLPEEFVLLSHLPSGKVHGSTRAAFGCAAAELGELTLRYKILPRPWKTTVRGVPAHVTHRAGIELLDTTATGLAWADEVLAELSRFPVTDEQRIGVRQWLKQRRHAFPLHRAALMERGVLGERSGFLGGKRRAPDQTTRHALITQLRAIGSGQCPVDAHGLFLCDLIRAVGLHRTLRVPMGMRTTPYRSRGPGSAESVPEELRHASSALAGMVPSHDVHTGSRWA